MKTKLHFIKRTILGTSLLTAMAAQAQFSYNSGIGANGDLLVCFRPASGSYDLVADVGSVSTFTNLPKGHSIVIDPAYYTGTLLAYEGTNNIFWSAFACERISGANSTNNIWVTRPRTNSFVQTAPWPCQPAVVQGSAAAQIDSIGDDAVNIAGQVTTPNGTSPASTTTAVVEPEGGTRGAGSFFNSYSFMMGSAGNLGGNFWGDSEGLSVEQSTPANFTSSGQPALADFYQLLSTSTAGTLGTYLGYFKFDTTGVLTYTAGPALSPPAITSITRSGTTTTIQFSSVQGFTYTLLATNSAGISAPRSSWPAVGASQVGDGATDTFTDVTSDGTRFYVITAQ